MRVTYERMTVVKFNRHLHKIKYNEKSCNLIYNYSIAVMKVYLRHRFGRKDYIEEVTHEIFYKKIFSETPNTYIVSPVSWLCTVAKNYTLSMLKLKDNTTLELKEDFSYLPELEDNILFTDRKLEKEWLKLEELTREIIIYNVIYKYRLKEIAEMLGLSYGSVRTRVSRAKKFLQNSVTKKRTD